MTGTWMQAMAQGWVMAGLTSSGQAMAWVHFAGGIPMIALTLVGGLCADRFDKRRILQVCQAVQILLALWIGSLVGSGQVAIWHVVVAAALLGVAAAFEMPAAAAIVPELAGREHVARAIAIDRAVFHGTRLIGPALAGALVGRFGSESAFYLNALSFVVLMLVLATLPPRVKGDAEHERRRMAGMAEGIRHLRSDRPSLAMVAMLSANTLCVFPVMIVLLPLYGRHVLEVSADLMGWLMFASGVGSLLGSLLIMVLPVARRGPAIAGSLALICAGLVSLSLAVGFWWPAVTLLLLALGVSTLVGLANTIVQERSPEEIRGRVSAISGLSFFGLLPFAAVAMGTLADLAGIRGTLLGAACVYAVVGVVVLLWGRPGSEPAAQ